MLRTREYYKKKTKTKSYYKDKMGRNEKLQQKQQKREIAGEQWLQDEQCSLEA